MSNPQSASVVIATYDPDRWQHLVRAISSASAQGDNTQVVVAVDNNPSLFRQVRSAFPGVTAVLHEGSRGASATRNAGARAATGEVLCFLDDDAHADPGWCDALVDALARPGVVGVAGRVEADWERGERPDWFPPEFDWVIGASYRGMPTQGGPVRNAWAENMALLRSTFWSVGGFREDFGKSGQESEPEDTDLGIRVSTRTGGRWWYEPRALVHHWVPLGRSGRRFFLRRCISEGRGKARLRSLTGDTAISSENTHARFVIHSITDGLRSGLRRADRAELKRSAMAAAGLGATASAYLLTRLRDNLRVTRAPLVETPAPDDPQTVIRIDLSEQDRLPVSAQPCLAVVRLCCTYLGTVTVPAGVEPVANIRRLLHERLSTEAPEHGLSFSRDGVERTGECRRARQLQRLAVDGPPVTVAVCTRNRPDQLRRALGAVTELRYENLQILVVDNGPETPETRQVVETFSHPGLRYTAEPRQGLSVARNRALREAGGEIVVFLDDDEEPDPWCVSVHVSEYTDPAVACVTGSMLPLSLETRAQRDFEAAGGFATGREFRRAVHTRRGGQSPLFPLPPFGAGGNMSFRREVLCGLGGFDEHLGAGGELLGAEDTAVFTEVLLADRALVHNPSAAVFHSHRATVEELRTQRRNYSFGLGGYYASVLLNDPTRLLGLLSLLPAAAQRLARPSAPSSSGSEPSAADLPAGRWLLLVIRGFLHYLRVSRFGRR